MTSKFKKKLLLQLANIPDSKMPQVMQMLHFVATDFGKKSARKNKSLNGIWGSVKINDDDFAQAKKSLFSYE